MSFQAAAGLGFKMVWVLAVVARMLKGKSRRLDELK